ncbi:MAG: transglycosylase domain-containing protein [Streptococcaceae bacterium]|jgi:penicillin-binding protein 1A|nr:transglycosylase domain-containing protein [Streptococcaceae bacterium]
MPRKVQKRKISVSSDKKKSSKKGRLLVGRILKWLLIPILTVGIAAFAFGVLVFFSYVSAAPKLDIAKLQSQPNTTILDKNGTVVAQLGAEQRVLVSDDQIPMQLVNAVTSIEDHRFFDHRGIDPVRIAGSLLHNATTNSNNGGSTLTQQLIKLSFFSTVESDRTLKRKAQEAWMAVELEKEMSKEQIFDLYVNKVNMGNGYYGMETAAKAYYQKDLKNLDLAQTALLAGIPNAPATYNPYIYPAKAKARRDLVLSAMYQYGKITQEEETKAIAEPITTGLKALPKTKSIPQYLDNYVTEVIDQVRNQTGKDPLVTGMKIYTPLDSAAQLKLQAVINTEVPLPDTKFQIAATIVDPKTGAVIAQMGGRNQDPNATLGFNQAVSTDRDFGSAMKPITDYAPAFQNGVYTSTADSIVDESYSYPGSTATLGNWDGKYYGNMTIRSALAESRNIPAVKTLVSVGLDNSTKFLKSLGIQYPQEEYANAISSNNTADASDTRYGASTEKMAAAYAAFSNGGYYTQPYYVNKVVFTDGTSKSLASTRTQVMSADTAYIMTDILKSVVTGQGLPNPLPTGPQAANISGIPMAGKTGTSNYTDDQVAQAEANVFTSDDGFGINPDENFVGYTTSYAMAVWTGYKNKLIPVQGMDEQYAAARTFNYMMKYFYSDPSTATDWTMPSDMNRSGSDVYMAGAKPVYSSYSAPSSSAPTGASNSGLTPSSSVQNSAATRTSSS